MISRHNRREKSELTISVDSLRDEVCVLRQVLDEIRDALEWRNKNAADFPALAEHPNVAWSLAKVSLPVAEPNDDPSESKATTSVVPSECPTTQRDLF